MKYQGVIFDMDGTLVDSALDFVSLRGELGLAPEDDILEVLKSWDPDRHVWGHQVVHKHELRGAEVSKLLPGVNEFLIFLEQKKIPKAIFTRNSRPVTELTIKKHRLQFSPIFTRDEGPAKPDPFGLHQISHYWKLKPQEVLFVGDYLYDLQAGLAAQMPTALYLPTPADFPTDGATLLFQDFSDLQRAMDCG